MFLVLLWVLTDIRTPRFVDSLSRYWWRALCYSLFTTLVKSVFLLCGAFLSNLICFVVYNRLSRCLVARLSHGSKVLISHILSLLQMKASTQGTFCGRRSCKNFKISRRTLSQEHWNCPWAVVDKKISYFIKLTYQKTLFRQFGLFGLFNKFLGSANNFVISSS